MVSTTARGLEAERVTRRVLPFTEKPHSNTHGLSAPDYQYTGYFRLSHALLMARASNSMMLTSSITGKKIYAYLQKSTRTHCSKRTQPVTA
jgi:hypothetical protein